MRRVALFIALTALAFSPSTSTAAEPVDFNRDVRPILSEHCWKCHGFDAKARQAGLRLDDRDAATKPADSGSAAIVPGHPDKSELITRITAREDATRMPPPASVNAASTKPLSPAQIETLRRWIAEGAAYRKHWSFEPVVRPRVPAHPGGENPIDAFVGAALKARGLDFATEAPRAMLVRRVYFDLIGLPPGPDEIDLLDREPSARTYEQIVDRLLASPRFGERMAADWLDAARYADTNGYFSDKPRQAWLWRDGLIAAFNANQPFDQFTVEQLAGDLLPDATVAQRVATGFNRNHMSNDETGIIDEEYRVEYVADRIDTTAAVWLGLTAGCAQCHDHKYDPVTQRDYYRLFAFFNNVPEKGLLTGQDPPPLISVPSPELQRELAARAADVAKALQEFDALKSGVLEKLKAWETDAPRTLPAPPDDVALHEPFETTLRDGVKAVGTSLVFQPGIRGQGVKLDATQHAEAALPGFDLDAPWTVGLWILPDGSLSCPLSKIEPEGNRRGFEILWQKGRLQVNLVRRWSVNAIELVSRPAATARQWHHVAVTYDGSRKAAGVRVFVDGKPVATDTHRDTLDGSIANDEPLRIGRRDEGLGFYGHIDELRVVPRALGEIDLAAWARGERLRGIIETPADKRGGRESDLLLDDFLDHHGDDAAKAARARVKEAAAADQMAKASVPTALVMQELSPRRPTHILERGQYDKPGEAVEPGVPASLSPWPDDAPPNRLGFARWLVAKDNPLTARVAVNRLWKQCFGEGLVRTVNDFGTQGEPPTHPELLDWLAAEFMEGRGSRDKGLGTEEGLGSRVEGQGTEEDKSSARPSSVARPSTLIPQPSSVPRPSTLNPRPSPRPSWDVKRLLRLIVTSRTYRQASAFRVENGEVVDPENRWLARGPSFRLTIEQIRDQALTASGLLVSKLGGPPVKPYQPPGLWEEVSYNAEDSYEPDTGDGLWRRSVYTFVKRQAPPPAMIAFDGPTREKCQLRRPRTNTPLQALLLLNDETYVEAARALATSVLREERDERNEDARLRRLWRRVLTRPPTDRELESLRGLLQRQRDRFRADPSAVTALLGVEVKTNNEPASTERNVQTAAWIVVAHALFNLDEAVTRR